MQYLSKDRNSVKVVPALHKKDMNRNRGLKQIWVQKWKKRFVAEPFKKIILAALG